MFAGFWQLADPRASIAELKANFANYLTLREHNQYQQDLDRRLDVLTREVEEIQKDQKTREGTIEHVHSLEKSLDAVKKEHDDLAKEVNSSVTIADRMKELQNEINSIRDNSIKQSQTTSGIRQ